MNFFVFEFFNITIHIFNPHRLIPIGTNAASKDVLLVQPIQRKRFDGISNKFQLFVFAIQQLLI